MTGGAGQATAGGRIARNFLALGSGEAVARVIAFGVTMVLARIVGPDGYGILALAMMVNLYLTKVADFGIEAAGTKAISDDPDEIEALGSAVLTLRLVLASVLLAVAAGVSLLFLPEPEGTILALFAITLLPVAGSSRWIHMGLEDARPVGVARIVAEAGVLAATVWLVTGIERLWIVPLIQVAGEALVAGVLLGVLRVRGYRFWPRWDLERALPLFRLGLPLLVQTLLGLLIYNSDVLFLRVLRDRAEVGWYAAAYALLSFLANLGWAWGMSLLPALARAGAGGPGTGSGPGDGQVDLYQRGVAQAFAVALPVALGAALVAPGIILLGFGAGYEPAVPVLRLLALSVPLMILRHVAWFGLVARARGAALTTIMGVSVGVNLVLNAALIPRLGMTGAAVATVVTEAFICGLMARRAALDGLPFPPLARLWRPVAAGLAMAGALLLLPLPGLVVPVAVGAAVFAAVLTLLGGLRWRPTPALTV